MTRASPLGVADHQAKAFGGWHHLLGVLVHIHPFRQQDTEAVDPLGLELLRKLLSGFVTCFITVVSNEYALDVVLF